MKGKGNRGKDDWPRGKDDWPRTKRAVISEYVVR